MHRTGRSFEESTMSTIIIRELDHNYATDAEYEAFAALSTEVRLEESPGAPPIRVEGAKAELQNFPDSLFIKS